MRGYLSPLIEMTVVQMLVVGAIFAVPVLAPVIAADLGRDPALLGVFTGVIFAVGTLSSYGGGLATARYGSYRTCQICLAAAGVGVIVAAFGTIPALLFAALLLGVAFGPETPASTQLLAGMVPPRHRSIVFSVRQTGNQIGAMTVSLTLPLLQPVIGWQASLALLGALVLVGMVALEPGRRRHEPVVVRAPGRMQLGPMARLVATNVPLRRLALASGAFSATQMVLNSFMVTYGVEQFGLDLVSAGQALGAAQFAGAAGRVGWGLVAGFCVPRYLLAGLGFGMTLCAVALVLLPPAVPFGLLLLIAFLFGVTASGWNGVFVAEIARLSPAGRSGEVMGCALLVCGTGMIFAPMLFGLLGRVTGLFGAGFLVTAAASFAAAVMLLRRQETASG